MHATCECMKPKHNTQPPTKTFDFSAHILTIDNMVLTQATSYKFLGITIDESLLESTYMYLKYHITYGILALGNTNASLLHKAQIIQSELI